jgi:phosphatidylinositol 4-kinase
MLEEVKNKPKDVQLEVVSLMAKSNDDLRQEVFVMQMIHYYKSVFVDANLPLWLKTYRILSTSGSTGLIQVLVDATSVDGLKKADGYPTEGGLRKYFEVTYDGPNSTSFKEAQRNFMTSLAAYSIVSYLLGLKDRHNGNIMIDTRGHLIFIDFGFAMGMAPGHEFSMERAPFKLTKEYVEVMGGVNDECYKEFERLFVEGFKAARKNSQIALGLVEIMMYKSNYPCFSGWRYGHGVALKRFEKRLMLDVPDEKVEMRAKALVRRAMDHWGTNAYDKFQKWSNGYAM